MVTKIDFKPILVRFRQQNDLIGIVLSHARKTGLLRPESNLDSRSLSLPGICDLGMRRSDQESPFARLKVYVYVTCTQIEEP